MELRSPNDEIVLTFHLQDGRAQYSVRRGAEPVIAPSGLGFRLWNAPPMGTDLDLESSETGSIDERWETVWGQRRWVRHRGRWLAVSLRERRAPWRRLGLEFRCYDDGVAFRYVFPRQNGGADEDAKETVLLDEETEFVLTGNPVTWWQPGDWDSYEHLYDCTRFSEIDALAKRGHPDLLCTFIPENAVNTPVTMQAADDLYLSFHEAELVDYPDMTLRVEPERLRMVSALVASSDGSKARLRSPWRTPWRTIQIAEQPGQLIESDLPLNLNPPSRIGCPEWIRPTKYAGIWWGMHLGMWTWDLRGEHGASTERAKRYVDFCAEHGVQALLIEGWNTGWERWQDQGNREGLFDFLASYPDYDLEEVVRYAGARGVDLIMHHETAGAVRSYESQIDRAFGRCRELGIHAVKTGYVGQILPPGEHHHGQWMVRHYQAVVEKAADHQLMLDVHEPIKPTGLSRTWPNLMTCEGVRGQEFNAWSSEGGNPPDHLPRVAFTRALAGPIDYTPGIVKPVFGPHRPHNRLRHTLAHELALYVVLYSPMQMLADLPEHYEGHPALDFIRDVPVDWEETRVLEADIGEHVTIARRQRSAQAWFVGSINGLVPRELRLPLHFLCQGLRYEATVYADLDGAEWTSDPDALAVRSQRVTCDSLLVMNLASGGGAAVRLRVL